MHRQKFSEYSLKPETRILASRRDRRSLEPESWDRKNKQLTPKMEETSVDTTKHPNKGLNYNLEIGIQKGLIQ